MLRHKTRFFSFAAALFAGSLAAPTGCSGDGAPGGTTASGGGSPGSSQSAASTTTSGGGGACGPGSANPGPVSCPITFTLHPSGPIQNPKVAGEWQGFDLATAPVMSGPDASGVYSATVNLPPGLLAYKLVYDQNGSTQWILDPTQGHRKYLG